jgi:hypothetical protein
MPFFFVCSGTVRKYFSIFGDLEDIYLVIPAPLAYFGLSDRPRMKSRIACFAAPSFQDASGTVVCA